MGLQNNSEHENSEVTNFVIVTKMILGSNGCSTHKPVGELDLFKWMPYKQGCRCTGTNWLVHFRVQMDALQMDCRCTGTNWLVHFRVQMDTLQMDCRCTGTNWLVHFRVQMDALQMDCRCTWTNQLVYFIVQMDALQWTIGALGL